MNEKKRVAFLCHPYHRGGVTRWMADAAIALSADGHEVYFITIEPAKEFFSAKGRETMLQLLEKEKNAIHIIKAKAGYEFEFGTKEYRAYVYKKLLVKLPPGTPVIVSDDATIWEAVAFIQAYPLVGVLHADEEHYYNLAEKYYQQVAVLICVSGRINKITKERIPEFDPARIYTIPCGINLPEIDVNIHSGDLLQLVYAGRISDYQKRTGDLVKICSLLVIKNTKFHLNIIGDGGKDRTALERKFIETGLQEYVTFLGWHSQKEVGRYLSRSDILILTSDFEGTPVAMMEALAAGCGITGTRVSGIEDYEYHPLAADCLSAYTVGDIEDAVNKINRIAAIPKGIRQQAARNLAESEFSMRVCLNKYLIAVSTIKTGTATIPKITLSSFDLLYSKAIAIARYLKVAISHRS